MDIWSNTDFPYQCLIDTRRTSALRTAIHSVVRRGDTVLDVGAGSGILAFFAAEAGASEVYAVEISSLLARDLVRSVRENDLTSVITVLQGDVCSAPLPESIDVCICELMDTGLMDEMQVPVINTLHEKGVIGPHTKIIPSRYDTFLEPGFSDFSYYGFKVLAPRHDWPYCTINDPGWSVSEFRPLSDATLLHTVDFTQRIDSDVDRHICMRAHQDGLVNAIRFSAQAHLNGDLILGATNALNGDKVVSVQPYRVLAGETLHVHVAYRMGGGLESLQVTVADGEAMYASGEHQRSLRNKEW